MSAVRRALASRRTATGRDDGFTLVELVIAITILGVIMAPLAQFMILYFQDYGDTRNRVADSFDIQFVSTQFGRDVASMGTRDASYNFQQSSWTTNFPSSGYCGQSVGTPALLLSWDVWTVTTGANGPTGTKTVASAAYIAVNGTLQRVYCASGTTTSSTITVVHGLGSVGTPICVNSTTHSTDCNANPPPTSISLPITISSGSTDTAAPSGPITVTGYRRQT